MGDEFRALIRGNVGWNSMLGKHMEEEELCKLQRSDHVMHWDEYALLGETIDYHKDHSESGGWRELFYEVHGDGHQSIWNPMAKDWSGGEGILKLSEGGVTGVTKVPWSIFAGESCQRSDDVGVIVNEMTVEISES